jgi:hypothetical protein
MEAEASRIARAQGWATFAGVLFLLLGTFNIIDGIVALIDDDYFVADELLFGDLSMWGVIFLIIGGLQLLTAALIFGGSAFGAFLGITLAGLNAIGHLLAIEAYPLWSIIVIAIDGLVIYGLTVYGDAFREPVGGPMHHEPPVKEPSPRT